MDELSKRRDKKIINQNKDKVLNILYFLMNKEEIAKNAETFKVNNLANITRMKELLKEIYTDTILILRSFSMDKEFKDSSYLTVLNVKNYDNLYEELNSLLLDFFEGEYILAYEPLIFPPCLSFNNEKYKLYLMNYDSATVGI